MFKNNIDIIKFLFNINKPFYVNQNKIFTKYIYIYIYFSLTSILNLFLNHELLKKINQTLIKLKRKALSSPLA